MCISQQIQSRLSGKRTYPLFVAPVIALETGGAEVKTSFVVVPNGTMLSGAMMVVAAFVDVKVGLLVGEGKELEVADIDGDVSTLRFL